MPRFGKNERRHCKCKTRTNTVNEFTTRSPVLGSRSQRKSIASTTAGVPRFANVCSIMANVPAHAISGGCVTESVRTANSTTTRPFHWMSHSLMAMGHGEITQTSHSQTHRNPLQIVALRHKNSCHAHFFRAFVQISGRSFIKD